MMINTLLMHTLFPGFDQASTRAKFKMPILKMHAIASPKGPWCMASYDMVNVWARWCHYSTKIDPLIFLETPFGFAQYNFLLYRKSGVFASQEITVSLQNWAM